MGEHTALTPEQIEAMVEEVIEANAVWPDPLPSQVWAVMDIVREVMEQAWDEGYTVGNRHNGRRDANPYRPTNPRDTPTDDAQGGRADG